MARVIIDMTQAMGEIEHYDLYGYPEDMTDVDHEIIYSILNRITEDEPLTDEYYCTCYDNYFDNLNL